jgi:glycosidase
MIGFSRKVMPRPRHPEWSRDAVIYQLNQRCFTPEGTFAAAAAHLPRLKHLGVTILWLMPVNPIGRKNRKGSLGSPYAVRDYTCVNHEFGRLEDLRDFVSRAHELGLRVIIDWVPNHTACDHIWVQDHPEWYARDSLGRMRTVPWTDWDDVLELDYSVPELRETMMQAMEFWLKEVEIDGFRCDVAGFLPIDFWHELRPRLEAIRDVYLLAEWENRDLHEAGFDATYSWSLFDLLHELCHEKARPVSLGVYFNWQVKAWPQDAQRMLFTSNHDKNSWEGTDEELFLSGQETATAFTFLCQGIPLVYNGQEAGLNRRLAFFEKDEISWRESARGKLIRELIAFRKAHPALWNPGWGAGMEEVPTTSGSVTAFQRQLPGDRILCLFNFSSAVRHFSFTDAGLIEGRWLDAFNSNAKPAELHGEQSLDAWGWRVLVSQA